MCVFIDFYRKPANRDISGWQGPSSVCGIGRIPEGVVSSRWQGKVLNHRMGDVRRSLVLAVLFMEVFYGESGLEESVMYLLRFVERLEETFIHLGYILTAEGWKLTKTTWKYPVVFTALLHTAATRFAREGCVAGRLACGKRSMPALRCFTSAVVVWWPKSRPR